ncbi:MAG: TRAP transporter substrate-binding protein DctP [Thermoanaerobaculia bacterium]|nr:TRAP transporter substrate-binding protein DctP [Thermoanaerobaculia bacterium]
MKLRPLHLALLIAIAVLPRLAQAQVKLKLGTVAPKDSSFHKILSGMGSEWSSRGVELKIFAGGARGGEADMVSLMRNGALDAGLLTAVGLSEIDTSVEALQSIPLLFRSLDEVDHVGANLRPRLEKRLREKGFVVLFWADAGWVRFFSKFPITRPDDLRRAKVFTWAGDLESMKLYRSSGFHPVPLETNDILPSLQTGMIDAVPLPPYVALTSQVFVHAPNMLQLDWAPLVGALVVTEKSWNRLAPDVQRDLARFAAAAGRQMKARNRAESDQAVEKMKLRGLKVTRLSPQIEAEWRTLVEKTYPVLRGSKIPADLFDEVVRLLAGFRREAAQKAGVQ